MTDLRRNPGKRECEKGYTCGTTCISNKFECEEAVAKSSFVRLMNKYIRSTKK